MELEGRDVTHGCPPQLRRLAVGGLEARVGEGVAAPAQGPWWQRHATSGALVVLGVAAGIGIGVLIIMGVVDQGMLLKIIDATSGG